MSHFHSFSVENFRVFAERQHFKFAPVTILTGTNSAGKSSLIRSLMLLERSMQEHKDLDKLSFSAIKELGDFSNALNEHGTTVSPYIKFSLPIHLDYLEGDFLLEVWFEKERTGLQKDGDLVLFRIYKAGPEEKINLFECSLLPIDPEMLSGLAEANPEDWATLADEEKEEWKASYIYKFQLNLEYIRKELSGVLDNLQTNEAVREMHSLIGQAEAEEAFTMLTGEDLFDEFMGAFKKDFYEDNDLRKLRLIKANKRKLDEKDADWDPEVSLIYQYFPVGKKVKIGPFTTYGHNRQQQLDEATVKNLMEAEDKAIKKLSEGKEILKVPRERLKDVSLWMFLDSFAENADLATTILSTVRAELKSHLDERDPEAGKYLSEDLSRYGFWLLNQFTIKNISGGLQRIKETLRINYLSSNRGSQRRFYSQETDSAGFHQLIEKYIQTGVDDIAVIRQFLRYWTRQFGLGEEIALEVTNSGLTKALYLQRKGKKVNMADLGFGTSQLIPILLNIAITARRKAYDFETGAVEFNSSTICIEEPEANLHPALQSKLADLLIDASCKFNIQFIIETHSEYLIRKLQYWTAKKVIHPEAVVIYYFNDPEQVPPGEEQVKRIDISEDGKLSDDFGTGFFDEADKIAISIWNLSHLNNN